MGLSYWSTALINTVIAELFIGSPGSRLNMDEIVSKACDEMHTYLTHKLVSLIVGLSQLRTVG